MTSPISLITPNWPAPPSVKAFTTTRLGGVSPPPYNGLNLGTGIEDDPSQTTLNRKMLMKEACMPNPPCWLRQVHKTRVLNDEYDPNDNEADGMVTRTPNRVCVVMTADCLPILLYGSRDHEVAAVHAGWRSLAKGILGQALSHFRSPPETIMAWLGPCIGPTAFEVGDDVKGAFSDIDHKHDIAFKPHGKKWLANLQQLAIHQLNSYDITTIYRDDTCTFNDKERFFSYRRDKTTGRMGSFIWLE